MEVVTGALRLLTASAFFLLPFVSKGQQSNITDGPYVSYHNGIGYVRWVIIKDSGYRTVVDSFPELKKKRQVLSVHLDGHPEWDFTVRLRRKIAVPAAVTISSRRRREAPILILSDIEGEFEHFRNILLSAHVIDDRYNWIFGKGKLIIAGDLFDRGRQVTQFLWLLYKLEDEAARRGGAVHTILGNHDIMNLDGDFRYVQPAYMENARLMGLPYSALYGNNTELGRWLRSKNIIEKIDGLLVMHGGISPAVLGARKTIGQINTECRPWYEASPGRVPDSLADFFNEKAIFWYRGYFLDPLATMSLVDSTLTFYGADKVIVGHDIIDHIAARYSGKVIGVDVDEHEGTHEALLVMQGKYYRIDEKGGRWELFTRL
jgi:Calcineurin-like phosphoesterase